MANKDLVDDPIYTFERRNHIPQIYNRDVMLQTIEAIPKIAEIREARESLFIANRILSAKEESKTRDLKFIEKYKRLVSTEDPVIEKKIKKEANYEFN